MRSRRRVGAAPHRTIDRQPSGVISGVSVDDDRVSWTDGAEQYTAALG
jgi:hypothetical protein